MKKSNNNLMRLHIDGRMIYMSGIGRCLREIIKEITYIDENIKIYLYGKSTDYEKYLKDYSIDNSRVLFVKNNSTIYSIKEQITGSFLNIKDRSNDIFYYPHYNLPYLIHKNSIFTIHDFIQFKFPEYFDKSKVKIAKLILNNSVKKAEKIIVDSKSTANDFYNFYPKFREKVEIIYNGISKQFKVLEDKKKKEFSKRNKLGKYILFIGNNKPHKNISGLIKAFLEIKKVFHEFKLVIISNGFNLKTISINETIKRDIIILDSISECDLIYYYNCAYMLVLPSFYEGFGLPIIEAMTCGCPVITSNVSSMPELGSNAAHYIDPYDNSSITEGIIKLIKNSDLRNKLIKKGNHRAKLFTWTSTAKKYLNIFKILAS